MPGRDIGVPLNYSSTIESGAGKGLGRHWGAFNLYSSARTSGAEWGRVVPSAAGKGWGRHWGAFKLL